MKIEDKFQTKHICSLRSSNYMIWLLNQIAREYESRIYKDKSECKDNDKCRQ